MTSNQKKITTILFDLDGVLRIYLDEDTNLIEKKHGLEFGIIDKTAFTEDLLMKVTTGRLERLEWVKIVGEKINNLQAALDWENRPVYIDNEVLSIVRELGSMGYQICLITNGTDNLSNELRNLGIEKEFAHIFNSAELGVAKPSPEIYKIVLTRCKLKPENIAYIDDNKNNVLEAQNLGFNSTQYSSVESLKEWLKINSLLID